MYFNSSVNSLHNSNNIVCDKYFIIFAVMIQKIYNNFSYTYFLSSTSTSILGLYVLVGFEVLTTMVTKSFIFWDITRSAVR
jgi:hypothetical protein